jgi:hypothetical protein
LRVHVEGALQRPPIASCAAALGDSEGGVTKQVISGCESWWRHS